MCKTPNILRDGTLVACRGCWQCRENRIKDWVGRCIAEGRTAKASNFVTLTYGRDDDGNVNHARSVVLTYSDVQKYFKRLRRNGYPCRYFAVGEYGSEKGRAHWHVLIYWLDKAPPHEEFKRFNEPHWEHGFSQFEPITYKGVRYCCKYILKDMGKDRQQTHLAMSKKPPIGAQYFAELAQDYVRAGLSPQSLEYTFKDVRDKKGRLIRFMLTKRSAEMFIAEYLSRWNDQRGGFTPYSEVVEKYLDAQARSEVDDIRLDLQFGDRQAKREAARPPKPRPWPGYNEVYWNTEAGAWTCHHPTAGWVIQWGADPDEKGRMAWRRVKGRGATSAQIVQRKYGEL